MKDKTDVKINNIMPCVPTRDLVVFPGMSIDLFFFVRKKTFILKCLKKRICSRWVL